jgi:hypothetical protein
LESTVFIADTKLPSQEIQAQDFEFLSYYLIDLTASAYIIMKRWEEGLKAHSKKLLK